MDKRKTKVYTYTRVSTAMQIDGYSLDAQKSRMKAFAEYNDYEIVREYEDAGKSGKSIEGRVQFSQMMDDIKEGKDGVSYVLVFKLSRFGRNAADVLSTLQIMQDFGVNLICVEDGIDSSKDAGKLMISVLSAVAEIERENIRVQTMEGRIQKAREGKWNGGFAPYGYQLVDGKLEINEEEAVAIRVIFDQYVNTNIGSNGIAKYLENHGIRKIQRQNGKNPLFDAHLVRLILRNPVYCGKIAYGRRRTEKVHGTRNDYHLVEQENYLLVDGLHEAIVSEEVWQAAQVKLLAQAKKYEHVNKGKDTKTHLLSGIVKCPVCGAGMYGNKCIKHKKDGTKYKDFYYYGCKHRTMTRGHKCDYRKQINEELLDDAVAEIIVALVSKPKFAAMMQEKINMKVDTSTIDQEVANHEKQLRQYYSTKSKLMDEIDSLDPDDRHYIKRKVDLDDRLYRMYDKIEEEENLLVEARAKKQAIEAEKLTADNNKAPRAPCCLYYGRAAVPGYVGYLVAVVGVSRISYVDSFLVSVLQLACKVKVAQRIERDGTGNIDTGYVHTAKVQHGPAELRALGIGHDLVAHEVAVAVGLHRPARNKPAGRPALIGETYIILGDILGPEL